MNKIAIERDVPLPPQRAVNIFKSMEVGDSVWIDEPNTAGPSYGKAIGTNKELGWKFRGAKENGGIRIWRVK